MCLQQFGCQCSFTLPILIHWSSLFCSSPLYKDPENSEHKYLQNWQNYQYKKATGKKKTRMQTGMHAQTNKILECMFTSWISLYKLGKPAVTGQLLLTTENRLYFCRGTHGYAIMFIIFFFSTALLLCLTNMLHIITALSAHTVKKKLTQLLLFFFLQKCLHIHQ